jgi:hypothetical protein
MNTPELVGKWAGIVMASYLDWHLGNVGSQQMWPSPGGDRIIGLQNES